MSEELDRLKQELEKLKVEVAEQEELDKLKKQIIELREKKEAKNKKPGRFARIAENFSNLDNKSLGI